MKTYVVAPEGNDSWSGTLHEPNKGATDGPFMTLARAREAVRELRRQSGDKGLPDPVTVLLRGGTYVLDDPFWLGPQDSGTKECPLVWAAYPGEKVVLSGGAPVGGWKPWQGKILRAPAPERAPWHGRPRQLFYKGKRQRRSRWPKFDPQNPFVGGWIVPEGPVAEMEYQALHFPAGSFPRPWKKPQEAEVNIYGGGGWCNNVIPLLQIDQDQRILRLEHEPINEDIQQWYFTMRLGKWNRFFVENVLEELSEPGEWYFDSQENMFYFWPPEDAFDPAAVAVPVNDCLVRLRDTQYLTLRGLTFWCTTTGDDYHRQGAQEGVGAMLSMQGWRYCGEALHIRGSKYCVIEECLFDQVGGNAVYVERDNYRTVIRRNEIAYAGFNGVSLVGDRVKMPRFCEVTDNDIHHIGRIVNYVAGVFLGLSDSNQVAHNYIHDVPHHAVNLACNGLGRNYIEWNEIRRTCQEISDTGAINSWMDVPFPWVEPQTERSGHFIRYNLIADTAGCRVDQQTGKVVADSQESRGIYLDDYTSNCLVWGNIILRSGVGVLFHGGKHNVAENNIIVGCREQVVAADHVNTRPGHEPMIGWNVGNRFCHNICVFDHPETAIGALMSSGKNREVYIDSYIGQMDENLYFHRAGGNYSYLLVIGHERTREQWKDRGFDLHSLFADPQFRDAKKDDYRLPPDSPAWKMGFVPIDVERIGIRKK